MRLRLTYVALGMVIALGTSALSSRHIPPCWRQHGAATRLTSFSLTVALSISSATR